MSTLKFGAYYLGECKFLHEKWVQISNHESKVVIIRNLPHEKNTSVPYLTSNAKKKL